MTQREFDELIVMINDFLTLDESNVVSKSYKIPSIFQRVLGIYYSAIKDLKVSKATLASETGKRYRYYKEDHDRELTKVEIENHYIPNEDDIFNLKRNIAILESQVKYLEETISNIKAMSFNIKNFVDLKKFFSGDY